jgi:hypothetical protein
VLDPNLVAVNRDCKHTMQFHLIPFYLPVWIRLT